MGRARLETGRFVLGIAGRGDDPGAGAAGPLNGVMADPARAAGHEKGLAEGIAFGEDAAMGRHDGDAVDRPGLKAGAVGQGGRAAFVNHHIFGRGAETATVLGLIDPDLLADAGRIHAFAHRLDDAGAVRMRNDISVVQQMRERPHAFLDVGRVHPARRDLHAHLALTGLGHRRLAQDQRLFSLAEALEIDGFHGRLI